MTQEKTNKIEIADHGIMLSDYFSGTAGAILILHIDNKTTVREGIEALESEINMIYDHIEFNATYHGFSGDLDKALDVEIEKLKAKNENRLDTIIEPSLDYSFEDMENSCFELPVLIMSVEFFNEED